MPHYTFTSHLKRTFLSYRYIHFSLIIAQHVKKLARVLHRTNTATNAYYHFAISRVDQDIHAPIFFVTPSRSITYPLITIIASQQTKNNTNLTFPLFHQISEKRPSPNPKISQNFNHRGTNTSPVDPTDPSLCEWPHVMFTTPTWATSHSITFFLSRNLRLYRKRNI